MLPLLKLFNKKGQILDMLRHEYTIKGHSDSSDLRIFHSCLLFLYIEFSLILPNQKHFDNFRLGLGICYV